jgi:tripartite-type tricarboxylate transporter receptor subunit TctC
MKKLISVLLITLFASVAQAEYTAENKIIKVVIPQPPASGLGSIYRHMEVYANKQNIKMVPVFKPGANAKIGIGYANEKNNDGNTLLFSTVSDYVNVNLDFDAVAPITRINMVLVASKKSKIKTVDDIVKQEQENPGKLTWAYMSTAQSRHLDNFLKVSDIDPNKVHKVPFGADGGGVLSLINGQVDVTMLPPFAVASIKDRITIVDINEAKKQKLSTKDNATGLFLPKNSNKDSVKFWNKFVSDMLNDEEFKLALKASSFETFTKTAPGELENVVINWKM